MLKMISNHYVLINKEISFLPQKKYKMIKILFYVNNYMINMILMQYQRELKILRDEQNKLIDEYMERLKEKKLEELRKNIKK